MDVRDVRVGIEDSAGRLIETVYVKKSPDYAIYRTSERVMVHLADSVEERKRQQEVLASINPIRSEIHSLIDGWRISNAHDKEAKTRLYDRRIVDGLAAALEGDLSAAQILLKGALDEITEERQSRGRIEQLVFATATAVVLAVLMVIASMVIAGPFDLKNDGDALIFAAGVGGIGALVSIGIAIRERSLATDLQTRDNIADAVLRVAVGAIGAVLLIAMLRSDLIDVAVSGVELGTGSDKDLSAPAETGNEITPPAAARTSAPARQAASKAAGTTGTGNVIAPTVETGTNTVEPVASSVDAAANTASAGGADTGEEEEQTKEEQIIDRQSTRFLVLLVVAFFAGFTERLVKQLADRVRFQDLAVASPGAAAAASNLTKLTKVTKPTGAAAAAAAPGEAEPDSETEQDVDGCVSDIALEDEEVTDDSQLPPAEGGVEEARRG